MLPPLTLLHITQWPVYGMGWFPAGDGPTQETIANAEREILAQAEARARAAWAGPDDHCATGVTVIPVRSSLSWERCAAYCARSSGKRRVFQPGSRLHRVSGRPPKRAASRPYSRWRRTVLLRAEPSRSTGVLVGVDLTRRFARGGGICI